MTTRQFFVIALLVSASACAGRSSSLAGGGVDGVVTDGGEAADAGSCAADADCGANAFCCNGACHGESQRNELCGCTSTSASSTDCTATGDECCGGVCKRPADIDHLCHCTNDDPGTDCTALGEFCFNGEGDVDPLSEQACVCGCEAGHCAVDANGQPICVCSADADCAQPVDGDVTFGVGRYHVRGDACDADGACTCGGHDACGGTAQCIGGACIDLDNDPHNCDVVGHDCGAASCSEGGCSCASDGDCSENTDSCDLAQRCSCRAYSAGACPLGLSCSSDGCVFDGVAYQEEWQLRLALGLPPDDGV